VGINKTRQDDTTLQVYAPGVLTTQGFDFVVRAGFDDSVTTDCKRLL